MKKLRRINRRPPKPDTLQNERPMLKCIKCVNPLVTTVNMLTIKSLYFFIV